MAGGSVQWLVFSREVMAIFNVWKPRLREEKPVPKVEEQVSKGNM